MSLPVAAAPPPAPTPPHWPTLLQFGFSALAALGLMGFAVAMLISAFIQLFTPSVGLQLATTSLLNASGMLLAAGLLVPSAAFALLRLLGRRAPLLAEGSRWQRLYRPSLWLLVLPLVLVIGILASFVPWLAFFILPPLHLLGVSLPIFWLVWLARRGLVNAAPQRFWGVLACGLVLGPLVIIAAEGLMAIAILIAMGLHLASNPILFRAIQSLQAYITTNPEPDMEALLDMLSPFLADRGTILLALVALSIGVPLIEEALKPIGLWFLKHRELTGPQGFAAGALSGAGFALFENVTRGVGAEEWGLLIVVRTGTALLHIFTSGLVGYGLALAWRERRYLRLGLAYLAAVALHGLWNGAAVSSALVFVGTAAAEGSPPLLGSYWVLAGPLTLGLLVVGMFGLLVYSNRVLQPAATTE